MMNVLFLDGKSVKKLVNRNQVQGESFGLPKERELAAVIDEHGDMRNSWILSLDEDPSELLKMINENNVMVFFDLATNDEFSEYVEERAETLEEIMGDMRNNGIEIVSKTVIPDGIIQFVSRNGKGPYVIDFAILHELSSIRLPDETAAFPGTFAGASLGIVNVEFEHGTGTLDIFNGVRMIDRLVIRMGDLSRHDMQMLYFQLLMSETVIKSCLLFTKDDCRFEFDKEIARDWIIKSIIKTIRNRYLENFLVEGGRWHDHPDVSNSGIPSISRDDFLTGRWTRGEEGDKIINFIKKRTKISSKPSIFHNCFWPPCDKVHSSSLEISFEYDRWNFHLDLGHGEEEFMLLSKPYEKFVPMYKLWEAAPWHAMELIDFDMEIKCPEDLADMHAQLSSIAYIKSRSLPETDKEDMESRQKLAATQYVMNLELTEQLINEAVFDYENEDVKKEFEKLASSLKDCIHVTLESERDYMDLMEYVKKNGYTYYQYHDEARNAFEVAFSRIKEH